MLHSKPLGRDFGMIVEFQPCCKMVPERPLGRKFLKRDYGIKRDMGLFNILGLPMALFDPYNPICHTLPSSPLKPARDRTLKLTCYIAYHNITCSRRCGTLYRGHIACP